MNLNVSGRGLRSESPDGRCRRSLTRRVRTLSTTIVVPAIAICIPTILIMGRVAERARTFAVYSGERRVLSDVSAYATGMHRRRLGEER